MPKNNYDPARPWTKQTFDEDYEPLTKEIEPKTNYEAFLERMSPEMLSSLMADNRCVNTCAFCSEMHSHFAGNLACDMKCYDHTLEFLKSVCFEKEFERCMKFVPIPKEEDKEC